MEKSGGDKYSVSAITGGVCVAKESVRTGTEESATTSLSVDNAEAAGADADDAPGLGGVVV